jgi:NAD-dependent histone deacetylase SIR2
MGTSLTVHPFAMLATLVNTNCPRVLINLEQVGDFSHRADDVLLLGKCDEMVRELCRELGWEEDLDALWKDTEDSVEKEEVEVDESSPLADKADLEDEVANLTSAIEQSLSISKTPSSSKTTVDIPKSGTDDQEIPEPKASSNKTSSPQTKISAQRL